MFEQGAFGPLVGAPRGAHDGLVRAIDWFEAARIARSHRRVALAVLAVAAGLAAGVFLLRLVVGDPAAAVLVLLAVPVALVAIVFGRRAGLAAAGVAVGLVALYHLTGDHPLDWVGYVARGTVFLLLGLGLGTFSDFAVMSQRRLSALLDGILDSVTVSTTVRDATGAVVDARIAYANAAAASFFGRAPAEIVGRRWSELWPASFTPQLITAMGVVVRTGESLELTDFELPLDHPTGTVPALLDLRASALGDGLIVAWREVSARLRDARALADANARFAAAFDHAPLGMLLVAPDRVVVQANAAFATLCGYSVEELVGMSLDELIDRRDLADSRKDFDELMAGQTPVYHRERRLLTAGGAVRWVAVSVSQVTGDEGAYAVEHVEDIDERKNLEARLQYLADHDPLTGLFNRRRFHEELTHQAALDRRYGHSSAVAVIDLDNFKYINDTLGHAAGDQLIQAISRTLHTRLRASDVLGRLGGDEFGVLLPAGGEPDLSSVLDSLRIAIVGTEIDFNGQRVRSTASIGVATTGGVEGTDPGTALANADLAMYAAKEAGRNAFVVYDPHGPHAERSRARFRWLDRIRHALDHDLFTLQAQPLLDLARNEVTGCELLLRMRENGELIGPDRFLYIAERHGLATAIDRYVIRHGIALAARHPRPPGFRWEINLSADSLGDPDIPRLIETELERTGLASSALVFEITETAAIANMSEARAFAARISDIGCRFALDDFGAGYGSFYYLKHLPFEYLKIDGEFVRQLTTNTTDLVIVQAIVTAAHRLGKQTIAEYVGDARTLDLLRTLHVDHAQGYHIGPPADPSSTLTTR
jgi:diguanylate cyclase (GGDEF)-like protein/PAS domain S-box-containing protein